MSDLQQDEFFMRRAITLARKAWGQTHPNPLVGAVIVEGGNVVAEGFHAQDGGPHAERVALANLGRAPKPGATLYVTLEPCSTHGRTGACCDAIRESGIRRVVVGATDPNPAHTGRGFEVLKAGGIDVTSGVLATECADLNLIFNQWIATGGPLLAAKVAITLDGKIACRTGESKWITGEAARADVHAWRRYFPGIGAGAATIMKDNPKLTARTASGEVWCPLRFVFDGLLRTVTDAHLPDVYTDEFRDRTIVVTTQHGGMGYVKKLRNMGVQVWVMDTPTQRVGFADFRRKCVEEKIGGVYFEGGAQLISELLRSRQLDYLFAYRAPLLFADDKAKTMFTGLRPERIDQAVRLSEVRNEVFGDDSLMRGRVTYPEKLLLDETVFSLR
ncbi:bifunctional diaminohydroxyphosphoribosylaminopyrimidine deaminase/5-amino-6-(5-phosphoribosylamino)uracil reductase RibD [Rariglobus hedericola]|uniref:Riboflavin biosynthesis protein RibD n=1 Tax=Rariglobus hedericola TaxID=2597822 RepID=A0A556QNH4_9BACT|nr:bifunctional diaminohydroxyphosphoribosylaminopyrimidine deaminase/5-amino-6-(5-phosphoribosylamino)uracil reductase RibD [Rariglobus hedericola]TSJ78183.1 bifunctional diaminohydroxyphosphoribosylaminopyrimidine deaminase/5-amino-6-(5-phosphoribosylamino)uracil reductase RibD [Rariglobus hedericola]